VATSFLTDQAPATLPRAEELADVQKMLSALCSKMVSLQWRVQRIARGALAGEEDCPLVEGDEIPTLARIGELYVFVLDARSRLEEAKGYLGTIEERLSYLDTVRVLADA
jgi:hypothetical protein